MNPNADSYQDTPTEKVYERAEQSGHADLGLSVHWRIVVGDKNDSEDTLQPNILVSRTF